MRTMGKKILALAVTMVFSAVTIAPAASYHRGGTARSKPVRKARIVHQSHTQRLHASLIRHRAAATHHGPQLTHPPAGHHASPRPGIQASQSGHSQSRPELGLDKIRAMGQLALVSHGYNRPKPGTDHGEFPSASAPSNARTRAPASQNSQAGNGESFSRPPAMASLGNIPGNGFPTKAGPSRVTGAQDSAGIGGSSKKADGATKGSSTVRSGKGDHNVVDPKTQPNIPKINLSLGMPFARVRERISGADVTDIENSTNKRPRIPIDWPHKEDTPIEQEIPIPSGQDPSPWGAAPPDLPEWYQNPDSGSEDLPGNNSDNNNNDNDNNNNDDNNSTDDQVPAQETTGDDQGTCEQPTGQDGGTPGPDDNEDPGNPRDRIGGLLHSSNPGVVLGVPKEGSSKEGARTDQRGRSQIPDPAGPRDGSGDPNGDGRSDGGKGSPQAPGRITGGPSIDGPDDEGKSGSAGPANPAGLAPIRAGEQNDRSKLPDPGIKDGGSGNNPFDKVGKPDPEASGGGTPHS